jgi:hypothetical protein
MRSQISIDTIMSRVRTTAEQTPSARSKVRDQVKIPKAEQDEDSYRYAVPGRDPVTQARGSG